MDPQNSGPALTGLLILLLISGAYYLQSPSSERLRPVLNAEVEQVTPHSQDVPTRLWQDPFSAVDRHRSRLMRKIGPFVNEEDAEHTLLRRDLQRYEQLKKDIKSGCDRPKQSSANCNVTVMWASLFGGNYPEMIELRRRTRYAVLSALNANDYQPAQGSHIGYYPDVVEADKTLGTIKGDNDPANRHQLILPYEWFSKKDSQSERLLLIWLNNDLFDKRQPMRVLNRYAKRIEPDHGKLTHRFLVPSDSSTLVAIASEIATFTAQQPPFSCGSGEQRAYQCLPEDSLLLSPLATIDERHLPGVAGSTLSERWAGMDNETRFARSIGSDGALMKLLQDELHARDIAPCAKQSDDCGRDDSHIALISEWDTHYGRTLPKAFVHALQTRLGVEPAGDEDGCTETHIHRFAYLRGLDGNIPKAEQTNPSTSGPEPAPVLKLPDTSKPQLSGGTGQFDYVNRLAAKIKAQDQKLKDTAQGRIKAIGILGSDYYDKLILLQALRDRFPGVVFFTTDLDARFTDKSQIQWTRNLLIASNFGLTLNEKMQGDIPPFRDGYQTSTFYAVGKLLNGDTSDNWKTSIAQEIASPRLYEVGANGFFDLSPAHETDENSIHPAPPGHSPIASWNDERLGQFTYIGFWILLFSAFLSWMVLPVFRHTLNSAIGFLFTRPGAGSVLLFLGTLLVSGLVYRYVTANAPLALTPMVGLVALLLALPGTRQRLLHDELLMGLWITILWLLIVGWAGIYAMKHFDQLAEPWSLSGGVSAWPTEFIRLLAGALSLYLMWQCSYAIRQSHRRIGSRFFPVHDRPIPGCDFGKQDEAPENPVTGDTESDPPPSFLQRQRAAWNRFLDNTSIFRWQREVAKERDRIINCGAVESVSAQSLWEKYNLLGTPWRRILRVFVSTLAFMVIGMLLIRELNGAPYVPVRSEHMRNLDKMIIIGGAVLPFVVLLFTALDASRLASTFMNALNLPVTQWPEYEQGEFKRLKDLGLRPEDYSEYLDVQLSADLTQRLGHMVYFPFIPVFLIMLSRISYFDDWTLPWELMLIVTVSLIYTAYCALQLHKAAIRVKANALRHLNNQKLAVVKQASTADADDAEKDAGEQHIAQIDFLIEELGKLHTGAFRPWYEQPLIKALLWLMGSISLFAVELFA